MISDMTNLVIEEQNRRLIEYAKETIVKIGDEIQKYHSRNHMDRTGNLLASLCWGVSYDNKLVDGGYYVESAHGSSWVHEFWPDIAIPVNGHELAATYLEKYGNKGCEHKWKTFFAILAPYWGYWEKGFTMKGGGGNSPIPMYEKRLQFSVMTQFFDIIKGELKPMRTRFRCSIKKYNYQKMMKRWRKELGIW